MYSLGIEIGDGGTRVVALDLETGQTAEEAWVKHSWIEGLPAGRHEQDPGQWMVAVDRAVRECLKPLGGGRAQVVAMGVAGPLRGLVVLDEGNRVVRPTKLAGDLSAQRQADDLARAFGGAPGLLELVGQVPGVESAAAECLWLKQHEPAHFQRAAYLLTVQDFITYWLTGERGTEAGSASATGLFDIRGRRWCEELLDFIDPRLAGLLPPVVASDAPRGVLRRELADGWGLSHDVTVGAGSAAPMLSALAAGCVAGGAVAVEMGVVGVVTGVGSEPVIDLMGEVTPLCDAAGGWLGLATTRSTAVVPEVLRRHYGWSEEEFELMGQEVAPGADGLLWLPYFNGETLPRLPEASGVLHGITPENFTPAHMARAAAEGVALGLGYAVSRLRDLGFDPPEVRLCGAGAGSPLMRQLLADVFGVPVVPVTSGQGAAVGAAMQAAVAFFRKHREVHGLDEMARHVVVGDVAARCEPDAQRHALYQAMMARQQYLVDTLHPAGFL